MTGSEKLRNENQAVRNEISDLQGKLEKNIQRPGSIESRASRRWTTYVAGRAIYPGIEQSVEFVSSQYDQLVAFK